MSVDAETTILSNHGVNTWLEQLQVALDCAVPSAYDIWCCAQVYLKAGDKKNAMRCQKLNYVLHNSSIPNSVKMGDDVHFGSGGMGVTLHALSEIGNGVVIGTQVTVGGRGRGKRVGATGKSASVPLIGDHVVISTGSKVLGGIEIGTFSVIGANSLVTTNIPPLSVVVGTPGRVVKEITLENCMAYKNMYLALRGLDKQDYAKLIKAAILKKKALANKSSLR
ncbi:serine O-acetyltransferase [Advenella sp. S44]|uniref:serine O-acetyltransferase n=1 Tax=Advenella sp. S44 TaxID=1982755 RepID=UPI00137482E3|nr:hypothetical protein [Advenella sp. S44]